MEKLFFRILGTLTRADLKPTCNNWPTDKKGTKSEQAIGWHKVWKWKKKFNLHAPRTSTYTNANFVCKCNRKIYQVKCLWIIYLEMDRYWEEIQPHSCGSTLKFWWRAQKFWRWKKTRNTVKISNAKLELCVWI